MRSMTFFFAALLLAGCTGVDTGDDDVHILRGAVQDDGGSGLSGATVSVAGIEAESLTDADGRYEIRSPYPVPADPLVTVQAEGFASLASRPAGELAFNTVLSEGDLPTVRLQRAAAPALLVVTTPADGGHVLYDPCEPTTTVSGIAGRRAIASARLDLVLLIDRSGSTGEAIGNSDTTIFDLELAAVQELVDRLGNDLTRIALVPFAAEADVVTGLTTEPAELSAGIAAITAAGPAVVDTTGAGTDFSAALGTARDHLLAQPLVLESSEDGSAIVVPTRRLVVLLSDGIPTLPVGSGLTQERGDIDAALAAAQALAAEGISLVGFAVGVRGRERRLTTLPAMAAISGGRFRSVQTEASLPTLLRQEQLRGVAQVVVSNAATGASVTVAPGPDGRFSAVLPVATGSQTITVSAASHPGGPATSRSLTITAVAAAPATDPAGLADDPVAVRGYRDPYGNALGSRPGTVLDPLYPDLVESLGTRIFTVTGDGRVTIDLLARQARWHSDIGYLVVDPSDLTASTRAAFAVAGPTNRLFNSHDIPPDSGAELVLAPGSLQAGFSAPPGSTVVLFITPANSLERAQAGRGKPPIFSVDDCNQGGYDQHVVWWSPAGRTGTGTGRCLVAFEDIALANGGDRDFWDILLACDNLVPGLAPACPIAAD